MGSFAYYNGSYQIPEEQRAQFAEQMRRILDLGGMMDTTWLTLFGQRLMLLRPIREINEETYRCDDNAFPFRRRKEGEYYFEVNYFEDNGWGSGGFTPTEARLGSDKVGSAEFSDTLTAAYMLYELYDPDYGCARKDRAFVEASRAIGWLNRILGTQFTIGKREHPWACMEQEVCSEYGRTPDIREVVGLVPDGWEDAVDRMELTDLLNVIIGTEDLTEDGVQPGTYRVDILKCKQALTQFLEEGSDPELLWELLEKGYDERAGEKRAELIPIAELTLYMPARVFGYLAAEIREEDFWELWKQRRAGVYQDERRRQYETADALERRKEKLREPVEPIRTSDYLRQERWGTFLNTPEELKGQPNYYLTDADRLYWWDGTDEVQISEEIDAWLKELAARYREIMERKKAGEISGLGLRGFVTLLGEINEYYWHIYPFEGAFQEFTDHISETEYAAAIELLRQIAEAKENRKAGSVVSYGPDNSMKSKNVTGNLGRLRVKWLYAVLANRQLRQRYFGF